MSNPGFCERQYFLHPSWKKFKKPIVLVTILIKIVFETSRNSVETSTNCKAIIFSHFHIHMISETVTILLLLSITIIFILHI